MGKATTVQAAVNSNWDRSFRYMESLADVVSEMRRAHVAAALAGYTAEQVWAAVQVRNAVTAAVPDIDENELELRYS